MIFIEMLVYKYQVFFSTKNCLMEFEFYFDATKNVFMPHET